MVKVHTLLAHEGVIVPKRTLERSCAELCGPRRGQKKTVRVADGEPGVELQVDFGAWASCSTPTRIGVGWSTR